jgi:hypothetical protein
MKNESSTIGVIAVNKSQNRKIGTSSATYVSKKTCPKTCPFIHRCLADDGHMGIHTKRIGQSTNTKLQMAKDEAKAIRGLKGEWPLRLHVVGDCTTDKSAKIVSDACKDYSLKHNQKAWAYTHGWRDVSRKSWGNVSILASCEKLSDITKAKKKGYATSIVVSEFESKKKYKKGKHNLIPCPQQAVNKDITCVDCGLCLKSELLKKANLTIAFEAHGSSKKSISGKVEL